MWCTDGGLVHDSLDSLWSVGDVVCNHKVCDVQMRLVRDSLDSLWSVGDVVLFSWMSFLQNDIVDSLNVTSPLTVNSAESLAAILDHDAAAYRQVFTYLLTATDFTICSSFDSHYHRYR